MQTYLVSQLLRSFSTTMISRPDTTQDRNHKAICKPIYEADLAKMKLCLARQAPSAERGQ